MSDSVRTDARPWSTGPTTGLPERGGRRRGRLHHRAAARARRRHDRAQRPPQHRRRRRRRHGPRQPDRPRAARTSSRSATWTGTTPDKRLRRARRRACARARGAWLRSPPERRRRASGWTSRSRASKRLTDEGAARPKALHRLPRDAREAEGHRRAWSSPRPITCTRSIALAAMDLGKHVYVQKPLTWSVDEARQLAKKATENEGRHADGQPGPLVRRCARW